MIEPLALAVRKELKARRYPHPVLLGPEAFARTDFKSAVVFSRDRAGGDLIGPPVGGTKLNPRVPFTRHVGGVVVITARSSRRGATVGDHEEEVDRVSDGVLTALYDVLKARSLPFEVLSSGMISADELPWEHLHRWPGAAAMIRFRVVTQVRRVDYDGSAADTGEVFSVANTYTVKQNGTPNP